jgi:hypothetical protein
MELLFQALDELDDLIVAVRCLCLRYASGNARRRRRMPTRPAYS